MSHITRGQKGNRLKDWKRSMKKCKAETCSLCMMYNLCDNSKKKSRNEH